VAGDFNTILYNHEKKGGAAPNQTSINKFAYCLGDCNLNDLGFKGVPFTWRRGTLLERLDRAVCNHMWRTSYENSSVIHIPIEKSDHVALWLRLDPNIRMNRRRGGFKFLAPWLTHEDFHTQVESTWSNSNSWGENVKRFTNHIISWNRDVFGHIFKRKQRIFNRIEGIHRKLQEGENPYLHKLKKELWDEYEEIISQEEAYWYHHCRSKWFHLGDRNNKFFH
jgi:hypothetical protein